MTSRRAPESIRRVCLVLPLLLLVALAPVLAQQAQQQAQEPPPAPAPQSPDVIISLQGPPDNPTIRDVVPYGNAVCPVAAKPGCGPTLTWRLAGGLAPGWRVEVRAKTKPPQPACFGGNNYPYRLTAADRVETSSTTTCQPYQVWAYDVLLIDDANTIRQTFDPLVVIDN